MPTITRPTELPEWASGGGAAIVDPLLTQKQTGWPAGGYQPPGEWFNWYQNNVFKWERYWDAKFKGAPINIAEYGAVGDGRTVADGIMNNGSPNLNSLTATFSTFDVGKIVFVPGAPVAASA